MSHTVHPYSHRLGIIKDWKSRWFGVKGKYQEFLKSDTLIRQFLEKKLVGLYVAGIEMERSEKTLRIIIETSRSGMLIGRSGEGAVKLKKDILEFIAKNKLSVQEEVKIDIKDIKSPESNAMIVAQMIAEGLQKRMPFRRVMKQAIEKVMANREAQGVKVILAGRLGGSEIARVEKLKKGCVPLQTFRADIDFARFEGVLPYGNIGIKVWIYKGEIFNKKHTEK